MKTKSVYKTVNELFYPRDSRLPVRKEVPEVLRPAVILNGFKNVVEGSDVIPSNNHQGGEEIPTGGWRGGEEIPEGGWRGGEEIPEGGWRASSPSFVGNILSMVSPKKVIHDVYKTKNGKQLFEFAFYWKWNHYEIDIFKMPSYGSRSTDLHNTHRLPSDRGGHKICFGDPHLINSLEEGRKWAGTWAECTMNYILHGNCFPNE